MKKRKDDWVYWLFFVLWLYAMFEMMKDAIV